MSNQVAVVENNTQVVESDFAHALTAQYQTLITAEKVAFRERVKFGAMLIGWENYLGQGKRLNGEGLKTWLEANCPEIGYKSAMACKDYAKKVAAMLGGGDHAMAALLGRESVTTPANEVIDVDAKVVGKLEEVYSAADSRRKLEELYVKFVNAQKKGPGRPKGTTYAEIRKSAEENAIATVWPLVYPILKHQGAWQAALKFLPQEKLEEAAATIDYFAAAIKAELLERV